VQSIRNIAAAFAVGALAALVIDAVLRNALAAAESPGVSSMTPWWVIGRVFERSVWVVVALLLWGAAAFVSPLVGRSEAVHDVSRAAALDVVGRVLIVAPLFWALATWLVLAARITLAGSWSLDGQMFASTSYYTNVLLRYLPWAGGGAVLLALSRHAAD
jgi:hypothetical protein